MKPTKSFLAAAADAGIAFESGELDRLGEYLGLLVEANETTNLTRIVDPDDAWPRHILDALQLLALLGELPPEAKVLDVGSGGGIPAIPLAIVKGVKATKHFKRNREIKGDRSSGKNAEQISKKTIVTPCS